MRPVGRVLVWFLVGGGLGFACGGPQPLGKSGDPCVRAADCAPGLVCVQGLCSDDLSDLGGDSGGPEPVAQGGTAGAPGGGPGGAPSSGGVSASGGAPSTGGTSQGGSAGSGTP